MYTCGEEEQAQEKDVDQQVPRTTSLNQHSQGREKNREQDLAAVGTHTNTIWKCTISCARRSETCFLARSEALQD